MKIVKDNNAIYVSIENGINKEGEIYYDFPIISYKFPMENIKTLTNINISIEDIKNNKIVHIPKNYEELVLQSLDSTDRSVTFGSILEKKLGIKDWHKYVSGKSRKDLIKNLFPTNQFFVPNQSQ
jgi:hypothetical protein